MIELNDKGRAALSTPNTAWVTNDSLDYWGGFKSGMELGIDAEHIQGSMLCWSFLAHDFVIPMGFESPVEPIKHILNAFIEALDRVDLPD